jgi:hypothetical protein
MTIVPASSLSRADMRMLGTNVAFAVRKGPRTPEARQRSLPPSQEGQDEQATPAGSSSWHGREAVA